VWLHLAGARLSRATGRLDFSLPYFRRSSMAGELFFWMVDGGEVEATLERGRIRLRYRLRLVRSLVTVTLVLAATGVFWTLWSRPVGADLLLFLALGWVGVFGLNALMLAHQFRGLLRRAAGLPTA